MSAMRKVGIAALALILALSLSGCTLLDAFGIIVLRTMLILDDDRADQDEIFEYVRENEAALEACANSGDFSVLRLPHFIKSILVETDHVDFDCGGAGMGPDTAYCGFFYSESDDLSAVWCAPHYGQVLTPHGDGFAWKEGGGDNTYYVEHICGHFYYYHATF